jgi:hypothetical protein
MRTSASSSAVSLSTYTPRCTTEAPPTQFNRTRLSQTRPSSPDLRTLGSPSSKLQVIERFLR